MARRKSYEHGKALDSKAVGYPDEHPIGSVIKTGSAPSINPPVLLR